MPTRPVDKPTSAVSTATTTTTATKKVCQHLSPSVYPLIKHLYQRPSLPSLPSLHSLRNKSTCSVSSVNSVPQGEQNPVMIVPTPAQAAAPCFNVEDEVGLHPKSPCYFYYSSCWLTDLL